MFWRKRKRQEYDLECELRADLDLEAAEQQASGLSPDAAHYAARRAIGNATRVKEDVRAAWGFVAIEQLWQDLRYAGRTLLKSPGFTTATVLTPRDWDWREFYVTAAGLLGAVAVIACLLPTRWAVKIDPMVALRYE